ncbi:MAG: carbohydrate-binding protein, partial [Verrucomicrobia bacterium]|nr:carbohydrate-binding protein [Verrucomicrobiota bacterium]
SATLAGTGKFTVLGSTATQIGIASSTGDQDGTWQQNAGSTLKVGIDFGGVTKIFIDDSPATTGTSATFAAGSLLDVGYYGTGYGGGTWTVMEVENGDITNNGLAFAPGVDTSLWSFSIDNSGANGLLKVTAVGQPAYVNLTVGNTKKQKMRYGLDYERLWYWYGSTANKNTVARWSMVDCDVDYIRVAMNCEYELTEGAYDLTAYTDKIIPMMQAMKAAKPNIKFFASPRPLNEAPAPYNNARWQPYPYFVTGDDGSGNFNFQWQKCAEYLVRYVNLMKTYGFKIDFMDMTNEWNYINATHIRDIKAYMVANLATADMPLIVAPSAWSYDQGDSWLNGVNTTAKKAAIDITGCHNTDKTGTAQQFFDKSALMLPGKEVWSTELHGWKGADQDTEIPSSSYLFETIRAGFSGINGWLAIGTTDQGHCYILNNGTTVTRNVKFHIFKKLTTTSNYGNALGINQPTYFTSTAALIRGNLLTVWVLNNNSSTVPVDITPTGRTFADTGIRRTRWNDTLAVEGVTDQISRASSTSVTSSVLPDSLYSYEILLDPIGLPYTTIQAESFAAQFGTTNETCTDTGGGQDVTSISNNDWLRFDNLAPGTGSTIRFRVARAAGTPESRIEVRQGSITGTVLTSIAVPVTGGLQTWETVEAALDPVIGSPQLFLKFVENGSSTGVPLANLNWLSMILPTVPNGVASAPSSSTQLTISWAAAAGATSYKLQRATTNSGPYTQTGGTLTTTSFTDTGLTAGTRYYYVVTAIYGSGVESTVSAQVSSVPSAPITATDIALASPVMGSDGSGGTKFTINIPQSGIGKFYQAVTSTTLTDSVWPIASAIFSGNGGALQIEIPVTPGEPKRFYKVNVWRE